MRLVNRKSKYYRVLLLLILLVLFGVSYKVFLEKLAIISDFPVLSPLVEDVSPSPKTSKTTQPAITQKPSPSSSLAPLKTMLPTLVGIDVPFLEQAPFAKWDALHEEACEEASLINVKYFLDKAATISKDEGEKEIQNMVSFEEENGYGVSITLQELNEIAKKHYKLSTGRVETNVTIEKIKKELALGRPVIVGAAGKILPNPFFRNGGPNYHMLVIKGYDDKGLVPVNRCKRVDADSCKQTPGVFITNDVGISQGNNFRYTYNGLFKAIHDWDPNNIVNGQKTYLVFD